MGSTVGFDNMLREESRKMKIFYILMLSSILFISMVAGSAGVSFDNSRVKRTSNDIVIVGHNINQSEQEDLNGFMERECLSNHGLFRGNTISKQNIGEQNWMVIFMDISIFIPSLRVRGIAYHVQYCGKRVIFVKVDCNSCRGLSN